MEFHRDTLQHHRFINENVPVALEGKPDYDCKGFCALEAYLLHTQHGYAYQDMECLVVDNGSPDSKHMVLSVPYALPLATPRIVLDDTQAYLSAEAYYTILRRVPSALVVAMMGYKL